MAQCSASTSIWVPCPAALEPQTLSPKTHPSSLFLSASNNMARFSFLSEQNYVIMVTVFALSAGVFASEKQAAYSLLSEVVQKESEYQHG